jgi:hypothetical protein
MQPSFRQSRLTVSKWMGDRRDQEVHWVVCNDVFGPREQDVIPMRVGSRS